MFLILFLYICSFMLQPNEIYCSAWSKFLETFCTKSCCSEYQWVGTYGVIQGYQ